jgi:hypothetical protein
MELNATSDMFDVSAAARSGVSRIFHDVFLGLAPQALSYRPLRGLRL